MVKVYVLKKTHTTTGNPNYTLFIPGINTKLRGLRKLKSPYTYSTVSYNLLSDLKNFVFKGRKVELMR